MVKRIVVEQPLLQVGCSLGEGPLYDASTSFLHFVDIEECKVHHFNTITSQLQTEQFSEPITCLSLRKDKPGLACAAAQGFGILEGNSNLRYIAKPLKDEYQPYTRFNDGSCDKDGRFLAGTMYSTLHDVPGELFILDPASGRCERLDGPFTDSNGLGWSPDHKTMYFTDSTVNMIYKYDYEGGKISNRRLFVDAMSLGYPKDSFCDGLCVDEDGGVWSARWGGSCVVRFSKDGEIDLEVHFPTALNITACCFGGPDNDQLYVTSAHCKAGGGDGTLQERYPDSGHVFVVNLKNQFKGVQRFRFGG